MPSYARLFTDGSGRGEALVAYLASLGAGAERERAAELAAVRLEPAPAPPAAARGAALVARPCAPCHGPAGRGDGPVTAGWALPTLDLGKGPPLRVTARGGEPLEAALARTIRFGLPPYTMAGHEWLSAQESADLAAFVLELARRGTGRDASP
jgi:cytochrome c